MAENSVFAILLRSSWWISAVIGAVIVLLCMALLPQNIQIVGAAGSLPFFVIAAIAAKRQWHMPSASATEALLAHIGHLSGKEMQQWLTQAWQAEGYSVTACQDPGADIVLKRDGTTTLVQTKRSKANVHGIEPLRALLQAAEQQGAACAYVLVQGTLSENARAFARQHHIVLLQNKELAALLNKSKKA